MKRHHATLAGALWILAALGATSPGWAASAQDQAAADVLFKDAKRLAAAGDFEHACPKFVESQRLDPSSGTLLSVGNCYENVGKLASAYGAFREAEVSARSSGDTARQEEAARRAGLLGPQLAKLAIVVPPAVRARSFEVRRDGSLVGEGQWGSALPADVGHHEITASAPGYRPWSTVVRIDTNGSSASVEVPPLEKLPEGAAAGSGTAGRPFVWTVQRSIGLATALVGVAGLGVGGALGGVAMSRYAASKDGCVTGHPNVCPAAQVAERSSVAKLADASTGALIAGGAALAAGTIVFLTGAPRASEKTGGVPRVDVAPQAGIGTAGLLLRGVW